MKKLIVLLGFVLFCVPAIKAQQSPCEKTFEKAKSLYKSGQYNAAKEQFQKVVDVNSCNSYKEFAEEYIKLCVAMESVAKDKAMLESNKTRIEEFNADSQEIERLKNRVSQLEKHNDEYYQDFQSSRKIIEEKNGSLKLLNDSIEGLLASIESLENDNKDIDSLKVLGRELNEYLRTVKCRNRNKPFASCDSISDISEMIEKMRFNIRMASSKSKRQKK